MTVLKRGPADVCTPNEPCGGGAIISHKDEASNDVVIENLTLDGSRGDPAETEFGIRFHGERVYIRGVEIKNCEDYSFNLNINHGVIEDCYVHDGGRDGINVQAQDFLIRGNIVRDCNDDHIVVFSSPGVPSARISIVGNVCDSFAADDASPGPFGGPIAIRAELAGAIIAGNVCRGGPQAGIIFDAVGAIEDVTVANNVLIDAGGNRPYGLPGGSGIVIYSPHSFNRHFQDVRGVRITQNVIVAPHKHGVMIAPTVDEPLDTGAVFDFVIARNTIAMGPKGADRRSGIWCEAPQRPVTDVTVADNDISDATGPGIVAVAGTNPGDAVVERWHVCGNHIVNSGMSATDREPAIRLDGIRGVSVIGNRAHDTLTNGKTQSRGLVATDLRGSVIVAGNTFTDNAEVEGVSLSSLGPALDDVRLRDNPTFNPWIGDAQLSGWAPQGSVYVSQDIPVTFAVPFPSGRPVPHVVCTVRPAAGTTLNAYAVVKNLSRTGCFLRAVSDTDPGVHQHKVAWRAEPSA